MGHLGDGQMKKWNDKVLLLPGKGQTPQIYRTWYKRLSLGNVQTCDGIFETMFKL
jgi:hypothetical protein